MKLGQGPWYILRKSVSDRGSSWLNRDCPPIHWGADLSETQHLPASQQHKCLKSKLKLRTGRIINFIFFTIEKPTSRISSYADAFYVKNIPLCIKKH